MVIEPKVDGVYWIVESDAEPGVGGRPWAGRVSARSRLSYVVEPIGGDDRGVRFLVLGAGSRYACFESEIDAWRHYASLIAGRIAALNSEHLEAVARLLELGDPLAAVGLIDSRLPGELRGPAVAVGQRRDIP